MNRFTTRRTLVFLIAISLMMLTVRAKIDAISANLYV